MPDFWSHHLAAKKANENRLLSRPKHLVWSTDFDNLFTYGAQGPDFFYYIGKFNPFSKMHYENVGNLVHERDTPRLFSEMFHFLRKTPSEPLMAYISGFLTHYIMDVYCHPLIIRLGPDSASHKKVELDLEVFCIHDYWGIDWRNLDVKAIKCTQASLMQGYVLLWQHLLPTCYDVAIDEKSLLQGHLNLLRIQKMIVSDTIGKLPFVGILSNIFHYDLASLRYSDVDDLALKTLREYETYQILYVKGIEEAAKALIQLDEMLDDKITVEQFIKTFIKYDFLGEA